MASPASVDAFRTLPPDKQKAALGRMSPEAKQALLSGLQTHSESSKQMFARGKPAFEGAKEQPSENLQDMAVRSLPAIGAGVYGIAASETGPGAIGAAGLGAAAGESLRQLIDRKRGKNVSNAPGDAERSIAKEFAGGAASEAVGQVAAKPLKMLGGALAKTAARGSRLPLTPSEAGVGGGATRTVEGFLGHAIPSKGVMDAFRDKQLARATDIVNEEIGRISKFSGTPEEAGKLTQRAIDTSRSRLKDEVGMAYKAVDQLSQNVQPSTMELKKTATKLMIELKEQSKLMDPMLLGDTQRTLQAIIDAPDKVPFQAMARSRSDLLALTRKLDEVLPGKRAGVAKLLAGQMDDAMMDAATKSGVSGLPQQLRVAQTLTREMHEKLESDLVKKIIETGRPEDIAAYVKQGGLQDIRHLNSLLSKPQQRMVQAQILRDALNGAIDPTTKVFDPGKFITSIKTLGEHRGQEIFGGQNYSNVEQTARLLSKLRVSSGAGMAAGMHNWTYMRAPAGSAAAVLGGIITGRPIEGAGVGAGIAGAMAVETATLRGLAKAITNPAKSARVVHYLEMATRGAPYAVYGLAKLVGDDEEPSTLPQIKDPVKQLTPLQ